MKILRKDERKALVKAAAICAHCFNDDAYEAILDEGGRPSDTEKMLIDLVAAIDSIEAEGGAQ